jgi:uncharacterized protein
MAAEGGVQMREYALADLPRLADVLAAPQGTLRARFRFRHRSQGVIGATVEIEAAPQLRCQRCLKGFEYPLKSSSEIEFAASEDAQATDPQCELYVTDGGMTSLQDLAEEELILALPVVAAHDLSIGCGASMAVPVSEPEAAGETRRPFAGLQDMLKKTQGKHHGSSEK